MSRTMQSSRSSEFHHALLFPERASPANRCPPVRLYRTAYTIQILGVAKEKAGRTDEAILNWEQALFLYEKVEGDSSFRTNQVRIKLGEHYGKQGKAEAAA